MILKDWERIRFSPLLLAWQILWPWLVYEGASAICTVWFGRIMEPLFVLFLSDAAAFLVLYRAYQRRRRGSDIASRGQRPFLERAGSMMFLLFFSCTVSVFLNMAIRMVDLERIFPMGRETNEILFQGPLWLMALVVAVAAPAAEEVIFRGMAYERLRRLMGAWASAGISSALFGVFHGNALQGLYAFILGIFLSFVYERLGGLGASVLFHAGANLSALSLAALSRRFPGILERPAAVPGITLVSGFFVVICVTAFFIREKAIHSMSRNTI